MAKQSDDTCGLTIIYYAVPLDPLVHHEHDDDDSLQGFSNYTKTFFVRKYSDQCQITNCYVC